MYNIPIFKFSVQLDEETIQIKPMFPDWKADA